jgi:hypothetical protein
VNAKRKWQTHRSLLIALIFCGSKLEAQCTQPPNGNSSLLPGTVVYYTIDASVNSLPALSSDSSPAAQINAAFAAWSAANTQTGGDGITFVQATGTQTPAVIVNANLDYTGSNVAQTLFPTGIISVSHPATISFYPNSLVPGTSTTNFYEVTQPGYNTAYLDSALHEIGHLQGIGDYNPPSSAPPPSPTSSVVSPFIGVNDQGNAYHKTSPTGCDEAQAAASSKAIALNSLNGGGGGGKPGLPIVPTAPVPPGGGTGGTGPGTCFNESYYGDDGHIYVYVYCYN